MLMPSVNFAECRNSVYDAECRHAECRYALYHYADAECYCA